MKMQEVLLQVQLELTEKEQQAIVENTELFKEILSVTIEKFTEAVELEKEELDDQYGEDCFFLDDNDLEGLNDISLN